MTVRRIVGHLGHISVLLLSACVGETCARVRDTADAVEEAARQLALDQSVVTLFAGDTQRLSLRGLNASDDLSAIRWQAADSEIARVDEGRIEALQEGATRVWATIENDSTSAIVVVEPRPPLFVLEPRSVTFDALQESMVLAFIPTGTDALPDTALTNACFSGNPGVATVSENVRGAFRREREDGGPVHGGTYD